MWQATWLNCTDIVCRLEIASIVNYQLMKVEKLNIERYTMQCIPSKTFRDPRWPFLQHVCPDSSPCSALLKCWISWMWRESDFSSGKPNIYKGCLRILHYLATNNLITNFPLNTEGRLRFESYNQMSLPCSSLFHENIKRWYFTTQPLCLVIPFLAKPLNLDPRFNQNPNLGQVEATFVLDCSIILIILATRWCMGGGDALQNRSDKENQGRIFHLNKSWNIFCIRRGGSFL